MILFPLVSHEHVFAEDLPFSGGFTGLELLKYNLVTRFAATYCDSQLFKADLLTFEFLHVDPYLVMAPKVNLLVLGPSGN